MKKKTTADDADGSRQSRKDDLNNFYHFETS